MKWWGKDDDGQWRAVGIPVSGMWLGRTDAALDGFEPENPRWLVPRKYGLGWDINIAAVAVKLGLIREDDSLPDLAAHVPAWLTRGVDTASVVASALVAASALRLSAKEQVPVRWSLSGVAQGFTTGRRGALPPVLLAAMVAVVPRVLERDEPESAIATHLANQADLLGVEAMALAWLTAMHRAAEKPEIRQPWVAGAVVLWPMVTAATHLACIKTALSGLESALNNPKE
ncbi:DUF5808 domain-containing protein [Corynebacterium uterequi]|uniref:DUF5808 domain-containing protein n=1 Tax=Corynebacterium uterequi TaxID=1072256 RepID=A0A0G3HEK6_9CORY|nr:DUF5808 domain-containing protein [Corynebacterium uterequi]AKK11140.1 hypothetical protein CUTER_05720 [Corynebacterium uterequi]